MIAWCDQGTKWCDGVDEDRLRVVPCHAKTKDSGCLPVKLILPQRQDVMQIVLSN